MSLEMKNEKMKMKMKMKNGKWGMKSDMKLN